MENGRITAGQLTAAAWAAVLAPAVGMLPGATARIAGEGAWLATLVALPAALLLGYVLGRLARQGLAQAFLRLLGGTAGRILTIIYMVWALMLACARLRLSGQRLLFTAQREVELWFFLCLLAAVAGWLAWGKVDAFVRSAAVFSRILTLALVTILALTVFRVRMENIWPLWIGDILPVLKAAVPALGVLCYGVYAAFLWEGDADTSGWKRRTVGGCAVLALLGLSVLGNMGAELTGALEDPFITLSKHVGVEGAFQRVESLASSLWLLGDLALIGLLLWACRRMAAVAVPRWKGTWVVLAGVAAILLGAGLVFRDALLAQRFEYVLAPWGNLALGAMIPLVLFLLDRKKGGAAGTGTSCGNNEIKKADVGAKKTPEKNF